MLYMPNEAPKPVNETEIVEVENLKIDQTQPLPKYEEESDQI